MNHCGIFETLHDPALTGVLRGKWYEGDNQHEERNAGSLPVEPLLWSPGYLDTFERGKDPFERVIAERLYGPRIFPEKCHEAPRQKVVAFFRERLLVHVKRELRLFGGVHSLHGVLREPAHIVDR